VVKLWRWDRRLGGKPTLSARQGLGNAKRGRSFESAGSPIVLNGQVIGAMGVSSGDGERCAQAAIDLVFKGQATTVGR